VSLKIPVGDSGRIRMLCAVQLFIKCGYFCQAFGGNTWVPAGWMDAWMDGWKRPRGGEVKWSKSITCFSLNLDDLIIMSLGLVYTMDHEVGP
jgi:hypothetical protein